MAVNWGLGVIQNDPGQTFMQAFERGQAMRREREGRRALSDYARNPGDPAALDALASFDPKFVVEQKQAQAQAQQQKESRQLIGEALAHPDPQRRAMARQQLAYTNSEMYLKLDEQQKKGVDTLMGTIAQQAFHILRLPREQQEPALKQALQALQAQGVDTSAFKLSGNPEVDLRSALAMTGHLDEWENAAEPKYIPVGEGGLQGFQFGQPIGGQSMQPGAQAPVQITGPDDYASLPPGTHFIDTDGNMRIKAGGGSGNAAGGFPGE